MKSKYVQYYVEGEDEEKIVNVLKSELKVIRAGKVQKFNVVESELSNARLMMLKPSTMVVLVFDTDTGNSDILNSNINKLRECSAVAEVVTVPQVLNLEDELVRSCNIKNINQLLNSKSKKDYKRDLISASNLASKLFEHKFSIERFWNSSPNAPYHMVENMSKKIKL